MNEAPQVVVLAGPNGAGKSTAAPDLLVDDLGVTEFVNADAIARGLSGFKPEHVAVHAGRIMLDRIEELSANRVDFAFETTLASRSFASLIRRLKQNGYFFRLHFLWLPSPEMAERRVAHRVRLRGHSVPADTIHRRYHRGLSNLFSLYIPLADTWSIFDNSQAVGPQLIASGGKDRAVSIADTETWNRIQSNHP